MIENSLPQPVYIPENSVELDAQLLRIDKRYNFKNKKLERLLQDDIVRSYLDEYQTKALYLLAAAYEDLIDASTGKYEGVFDNAAELVYTDIMFIVNIARSKSGINVRVMKGRAPLEELRKENFFDKIRPFQQQQQNQQYQPNPQQALENNYYQQR